MDEIEEILREKLNNYSGNFFFKNKIKKNKFFSYLKEYREAVKYIPRNILEYTETDDEEQKETFSMKITNDGPKEKSKKSPRVLKIEELREKHNAMKGKSLNVVDSLKRKQLKKRLQKKLKLEERMKLKMQNKTTVVNKGNKTKHLKGDGPVTKKVKQEDNHDKEISNSVVYSKLDLPHGADEETKKKGPRDPMRILQKVEKSQKKLREMEARGKVEKVKEIKDRLAWETAISKAEGKKVKDDVELLKKTVRRKKNAKNRSKKKWEERENSKVKRMEEVQKKRKTNIQAKKKEKQKKKMKKLVKKGRVVS